MHGTRSQKTSGSRSGFEDRRQYCKNALKLVLKLYRIEEDVLGKPASAVFALRAEKATPILEDLRKWIEDNLRKVPPKSPTGKAFLYIHNEWPHLARYIEDGNVSIDNNFVENKIRPFVIVRKRWLFSDTVHGVKASAALYSIVETAKANNIEPYKYLRHIFEKLPLATSLADYEELLPWNAKI